MTLSNKNMKLFFHVAFVLFGVVPINSHATEISELFQRVNPTVVVLRTFEKTPDTSPSRQGLVSTQSLGTGVLISKDGKVLTAAHVVNLAESIHVEFGNGEKTLGRVIASDPLTDVALIQLSSLPQNVHIAPLGNSDLTRIGEQIIVIGTPYGYDHSLTVGYISARRKSEGAFGLSTSELFQTDAAINRGNSGGPMFNLQGEVIGIVSHIKSQSGGSEGLGFAVSMKTVSDTVLNNNGFWNGIKGHLLDKKTAKLLNIPTGSGLLVERIASGSPGGLAGLRGGDTIATIAGQEIILGGDVIISINGIALDSRKKFGDIRKLVRKKPDKGETANIEIAIYREGRKSLLTIERSQK